MTIKNTTHPAAGQTAARRWARITGKGEDRATKTGAAGLVGGGKHSNLLLRWLDMAGHCGGQLGRIPQNLPSHIWPQPFTTHASHPLDQRAFVCRRFALAVTPKTDCLRRNPKLFRQLCDAPGDGDGFLNWFHAVYSTHVDHTNLHLCLIYFQHLFSLAKWL
jgi:hypothetical protein